MDYSNNLPAQDPNTTNYPVPTNKTNRALIPIIVILLLILIGGGGFILAKYLYSPKPVSDITNQPITNSFSNLNSEKVATIPSTVDETVDWKTQTYSSFSLKVPSDWFVSDGDNNNFAQLSSYDSSARGAKDYNPAGDLGLLKLEVYQEKFSGTLENFVSADHKNSEELRGQKFVWSDTPATIDGRSAIKSTRDINKEVMVIYTKNPNKPLIYSLAFYFDIASNEKLIDQILSTFKFL